MAHETSADFHPGRPRSARRDRKRHAAAPAGLLAAGRAPAAVIELSPRKLPRQARAQATFEAIVGACAQMLAAGPYEALTTNSISERAGVSIGTLYEYFPNRESIIAALAANSCRRLVSRMRQASIEAASMGELEGTEHLLGAGIDALASSENAFDVMLREAPFVLRLPAMLEARAALTALCQSIRIATADRLNLPEPEADTWLLSHMLFTAMTEIALLPGEAERTLHRRELARLTCRMALGRDLQPAGAAQP